jgi:HK97 family phage major capsid protein
MNDLQKMRAKLRELLAELPAIKAKAHADDATEADIAAYDAKLDEIEKQDTAIDREEREEALLARSTKIATQPIGEDDPADPVFAVPAVKVDRMQSVGLLVAGAILGKQHGVEPLKFLEDNGYGQFVKEVRHHQRKAAPTPSVNIVNGAASGGVLVPAPLAGSIIEMLYPQTTFLQGNPRRVPLIGGKYHQARGATGATAGYVGEGQKKPLSAPTFNDISMQARKLATIVPITQEAKMWTISDIESYVRADASMAMALKMDQTMYYGTGVGEIPLGIFNKPGITQMTAVGRFASQVAPTLPELDNAASAMILSMTSVNLYQNPSWAWLMPYRTLTTLQNKRVGSTFDGDVAYPTLQGIPDGSPTGLSWKGIRVLVSNQVPSNLGTGGVETNLSLIDFSQVLFGDEGSMIVKTSEEATLDSSGTLIHLWQQNMFAILFEMFHDVGLRHDQAVVTMGDVRF